jgi:hypothetical protein
MNFRRASARISGGIAEIYPPDYPAHLTGNRREAAGKCPGHYPAKAMTHPRCCRARESEVQL